ncbi:MAG: DUF192 domain-containing protein [Anaerolineales bacterium]|nr:DUF192 domain-containing protein [Anaerolineales bacterium]
MNHSGDRQKIIVYADDGVLARDVIFCSSSDSRRGGLLGRKALGREEGVLLKMPGGRSGKAGFMTSIHMLGMRFPIAAAWLDEEGVVVHSVLAKPWRPYYASSRRAWYVLEVHPNLLERIPVGKVLGWERAGQAI